jgi:hypothetical protein
MIGERMDDGARSKVGRGVQKAEGGTEAGDLFHLSKHEQGQIKRNKGEEGK